MTQFVKKFFISHVFKDISSMKERKSYFGSVEDHHGIPWKLCMSRRDSYLCVYIYCAQSAKEGAWLVNAEYKIVVKSLKTGKGLCLKSSADFISESPKDNWGTSAFMKWEDMEKDYLVDDKLIIEADVVIRKIEGIEIKKLRNFDETMKDFSDVVLVVQDEKFYVSKLFLASQSTFFEPMLLKKELETAEISLEVVDPYYFQSFLESLYGESSINDDTIEPIHHLATIYDTQTIIRKCEDFLVKDSKKSNKEKLELAKRYKFETLKKSCLSKINTLEDIRSALSDDVDNMDSTVLGNLLQKSLKLIQ